MPQGQLPDEASVAGAILHVFEAGQKVVLDRIELVRFDVRANASRSIRAALLLGVAALFLVGAWAALSVMVVLLLQDQLSLPASLAVVSVANAAIGIALFGVALQQARNGEESPLPRTNGTNQARE